MTDLGTLGGMGSEAFAINSSGIVIGLSSLPGDLAADPFIYNKGKMTDLYSLLPPGAGVTNLLVQGINDRGQIVGYGSDSSGDNRAILLTPSDDNAVQTDHASRAMIEAPGASQVDSQRTQIASFGPSQWVLVSPPSPHKSAASSPQETAHVGRPRVNQMQHLEASHRPATRAAAWEVIDRLFADFDN
jgi:hypothetical protein